MIDAIDAVDFFLNSAALLIEQKLTLINDNQIIGKYNYDFDTQLALDLLFNSDFNQNPPKLCVNLVMKKFYLK